MRRAIILTMAILLNCLNATAGTERLWLLCDASTSWVSRGESGQTNNQTLFITISAADDNSERRLILTIRTRGGVGADAFYSWSEGLKPDTVTADVTPRGWRATNLRFNSDGTQIFRTISIERASGKLLKTYSLTQSGVVIQQSRQTGDCRPTESMGFE